MPDKKPQKISLNQSKLGPPPPQMKEFDFFIGHWDVAIENFNPDGSVASEEQAVWVAKYINGGRMVLDEFTRITSDGVETSHSVTLRTFCTDTDQWEMTFLFSLQKEQPLSFRGRFIDSEGRFQTVVKLSDELMMTGNITFCDIQQNSFVWRLETSLDGGETWFPGQTSIVTRST